MKNPHPNPRDEATAYHEAGHAFAAWSSGFKVKKATIVPDPGRGSLGLVCAKPGLHLRSLDYSKPSASRLGRLHQLVVYSLAGYVAQRRYRPSSIRSYHARNDHQSVVDFVFSLHAQNEAQHVIRYLQARTRNLIESPVNWPVIAHLAAQLLKRRTMTGQEVEATIREGYAKDLERMQAGHSPRIEPSLPCGTK